MMYPAPTNEFISGAGLILSASSASTVSGAYQRVHLGRRLDTVGVQRQYVGYGVDHHTDQPLVNVQHDHHREIGVRGALAGKLQTQVDDGHDHAAQIDNALDEVRAFAMRVGAS
jgi:hypothetical protein